MKLHRPVVLALVSLILTGCGQSASDPADKDKKADADTPGVALTDVQAKSLGVVTAPVKSAVWMREVTGYGTVVALDTIAQTDADYLTASAAAAQSQAAAQRARSLSTGDEAAVSREVVEAAQSKAAADAASLALAKRKADAAFGIHAPWHNETERGRVMAELSSGKTVLVRVTFPLGALPGVIPAKIGISRLGAQEPGWTSTRIWEAPSDPALPGRGFYVLVSGSDLAQNEHVFASVPVGQAQNGLWVPASALVMGDGADWVYLENGDNHFLRSPVDTGKPLNDGYFVPAGGDLAAGKKVVTQGAGILLSREANPSSDSGDKD
ncbi:MAG TPA: hypothetical protein VKB67_01125 [Rhizomicrobium sp.]|nr:hypothetical protein [Rhizomicrobium sp.]